jgi:hypothetical protein
MCIAEFIIRQVKKRVTMHHMNECKLNSILLDQKTIIQQKLWRSLNNQFLVVMMEGSDLNPNARVHPGAATTILTNIHGMLAK